MRYFVNCKERKTNQNAVKVFCLYLPLNKCSCGSNSVNVLLFQLITLTYARSVIRHTYTTLQQKRTAIHVDALKEPERVPRWTVDREIAIVVTPSIPRCATMVMSVNPNRLTVSSHHVLIMESVREPPVRLLVTEEEL